MSCVAKLSCCNPSKAAYDSRLEFLAILFGWPSFVSKVIMCHQNIGEEGTKDGIH